MDDLTLIKSVHSKIISIFNVIIDLKDNESEEYSDWLEKKTQLAFQTIPAKSFPIQNNHIYWANLGFNIGSEEGKHRPILVTRTSIKSPVCTIIPLTSQRQNDGYWYHIDLNAVNGTALVEQMRVIDKKRIDKPVKKQGKIIKITQDDWNKINKQIMLTYSLKSL